MSQILLEIGLKVMKILLKLFCMVFNIEYGTTEYAMVVTMTLCFYDPLIPCIKRNPGLKEIDIGLKIARRNINSPRPFDEWR